ncbi:hypothetical protein OH492_29435 [Vibrio chagasii]|nr:hypothetical protein [Vibrio chagasii]
MKHNGVFTDLGMEDGRSEAIFIAAEDLSEKRTIAPSTVPATLVKKMNSSHSKSVSTYQATVWKCTVVDRHALRPLHFRNAGYYHGDNLPMHPGT